MQTMHRVAISSTGLFTPPHVITNEELVTSFNQYVELQNAEHASEIAAGTFTALTPSNVEFIEKASGIKRRYVLEKTGVLDPKRMRPNFVKRPDDEISLMAEIGVAAAQDALNRAGKTAADVDFVICASANMQRAYPAMAIEIQTALGIKGFGFDMNVACSSATFGLEMAYNAVKSGASKGVLVVNPEITSAHLAWKDRDCHFIFGDVCTAILVERLEMLPKVRLRFWGRIASRSFPTTFATTLASCRMRKTAMWTTATSYFNKKAARCSKRFAHWRSNTSARIWRVLATRPEQTRRFWLHQANINMNQFVTRKLIGRDPTPDEAPIILDEFANTASAGSIIAFHRHHEDIQAGDVGVICSFGAGYSIGSVVVKRT